MRSKMKTVLLLAACAVGCQSIDLPDGGEVRVVKEIRPQNHGAYVLVYRTELAPAACAALDAEIEKVWNAVRPRAEESQASFANVIAEDSNGGSTIGLYRRASGPWRRMALKDAQCPAA